MKLTDEYKGLNTIHRNLLEDISDMESKISDIYQENTILNNSYIENIDFLLIYNYDKVKVLKSKLGMIKTKIDIILTRIRLIEPILCKSCIGDTSSHTYCYICNGTGIIDKTNQGCYSCLHYDANNTTGMSCKIGQIFTCNKWKESNENLLFDRYDSTTCYTFKNTLT